LHFLKYTQAAGVAQKAKHLSSKQKALVQLPVPSKKKKEKSISRTSCIDGDRK
jgi:hypothetical protein